MDGWDRIISCEISQMGPPPKFLIERKLVRSVSRKVVPQHPLLPLEYYSNIFNCWKSYGIDDPRCLDAELQFEYVTNF
jgi:hypothetical protein